MSQQQHTQRTHHATECWPRGWTVYDIGNTPRTIMTSYHPGAVLRFVTPRDRFKVPVQWRGYDCTKQQPSTQNGRNTWQTQGAGHARQISQCNYWVTSCSFHSLCDCCSAAQVESLLGNGRAQLSKAARELQPSYSRTSSSLTRYSGDRWVFCCVCVCFAHCSWPVVRQFRLDCERDSTIM